MGVFFNSDNLVTRRCCVLISGDMVLCLDTAGLSPLHCDLSSSFS